MTTNLEARRAIEAILMVADQPIEPNLLAQVCEIPASAVEEICREIAAEYEAEARGFVLARVAGGYRYQSHPDCAPYIERFVLDGQSARLSAAALETLAIVAYKQPISRAQVASIRGVSVDGVMKTLQARGYITEVARDPGPGNAVLFGTTPIFLERLGLDSVDQLPALGAFVPGADVVEQLERTLRVTDDVPSSPPATEADPVADDPVVDEAIVEDVAVDIDETADVEIDVVDVEATVEFVETIETIEVEAAIEVAVVETVEAVETAHAVDVGAVVADEVLAVDELAAADRTVRPDVSAAPAGALREAATAGFPGGEAEGFADGGTGGFAGGAPFLTSPSSGSSTDPSSSPPWSIDPSDTDRSSSDPLPSGPPQPGLDPPARADRPAAPTGPHASDQPPPGPDPSPSAPGPAMSAPTPAASMPAGPDPSPSSAPPTPPPATDRAGGSSPGERSVAAAADRPTDADDGAFDAGTDAR